MVSFIEAERFLPGVDNDRLFNFAHELAKAQEVMQRYVAPHAVLHWLRNQTESFLAEFGVGEAFSIQPPYRFKICDQNSSVKVFSSQAPEYGEQSASFRSAEGFPNEISEGLARAYRLLSVAEEGEGVIIVSPSDFYRDYGSRYDVANFFRVVEVQSDDSRLVEGRYTLLNGRLSDGERAFLLNWHGGESRIAGNTTPNEIVRTPQRFCYRERELREEDPIAAHVTFFARVFEQQFGKRLLWKERDQSMHKEVMGIVGRNLELLRSFLLAGNKKGFMGRLKAMMLESQSRWAEEEGIDPKRHLADLLEGRLIIGGIHPVIGMSTEDAFGGTDLNIFNLGAEKQKGQCAKHGKYEGDECPRCKKEQ